MSEEKRRFTRVPFRLEAELAVDNILYKAGEIKNLSIGGCLLPITVDLAPGAVCLLTVVLSGTSSELSIRTEGRIVRCTPGGVAVRFTQIDPDSLFHLQNIILYNSPDSEKVEVEIEKHPGLV